VTPAAVLLHELAEARRAGRSFEDVWEPARGVALAAAPSRKEGREWGAAFTETRPAWEAAFERRPAVALEVALRQLAATPT
jgi:hypothetical protein